MFKKLIDWYKKTVINVDLDYDDVKSFVKRYAVLIGVAIVGAGLIWYGLSEISSETRELNRIVEKRVAIEQQYEKIVEKNYIALSYAQKREQVDTFLKNDNEYRGLNVEFSKIETGNRAPTEAFGYTVLAFGFALLLASLTLFVYTKHQFVQDTKVDLEGLKLEERKLIIALKTNEESLNKKLSIAILAIIFVPVFSWLMYFITVMVGK